MKTGKKGLIWLVVGLLLVGCTGNPSTPTPSLAPTQSPPAAPIPSETPSEDAAAMFSGVCWVAYSPTNYDPNQSILPDETSIREDLTLLKSAGVTGIITYTASDVFGSTVPKVAQELGYKGIIIGVWDPSDKKELAQAAAVVSYPITLGFTVGNEGLGSRYDLKTLKGAVDSLREITGKPVSTSEQFGDYTDSQLLNLGDWIFPNTHPYFANQVDPDLAVNWTESIYDDFKTRANGRLVVFKELGLPTEGDPNYKLSENDQAQYYKKLRTTGVKFAYFEAFDQPWKTDPPVEPYWGFFKANRDPKLAAQYLCTGLAPKRATVTPELIPTTTATPTPLATPTPNGNVFNVYTDAAAPDNHFIPSGAMGDTGDVAINETWEDNPQSGKTAIRVIYDIQGQGPNACNYKPPCQWAGLKWLEPADNWGIVPLAGHNLSGFKVLKFWARSDTNTVVQFSVGGVTGKYPDSIQPERKTKKITLTRYWTEYEINLKGADLSYVIGGFSLSASAVDNQSKRQIFYLDNIRFDK